MSVGIGPLMTDEFIDVRVSLALITTLANGQYSNGKIYHVDGNAGNDTNDGLSWDTAMKTLAATITLSNASFSGVPKQWAARNRIFIKGDCFVEDLVDLPSKCDIIGVGSRDSYPTACIMGNHSTFATARMGCRFINVMFIGPAGGGDIITLSNNISGQAFIGCYFDGSTTTPCTGAIVAINAFNLEIVGCYFDGPFSDAVIELGAEGGHHLLIKGNVIHGSNEGIAVASGFTNLYKQSFIIDNVFKTTLACINDASGKIVIAGNRGVTLAAKGTAFAGAIVGSVALSVGNLFTCSDESSIEWPPCEALGTAIVITKTIVSSTIPDDGGASPQGAPLTGAADGDLYLDEIVMQTDAATGLAGPTTVQVVCDNTDGLTGDDVPIWDEAVTSLGAGKTINNAIADVNLLPIMLESGAKLYINGDDGDGTGAGTVEVIMKFRRATVAASIAAA